MANTNQYQILRLPCVKQKTGLSRSTIYASISKGSFPKPIRLGPPRDRTRAVGWLMSEIDQWIQEQIKMSRNSDNEMQ